MSTLRQRAPIVVLSPDVTDDESRLVDESVTPFTPPDFTVKDLLNAIPKHCFERNGWRSSAHLLVDILLVSGLFYAATFIDGAFGEHGSVLSGVQGTVAKYSVWSAYWFAQGLAMTGTGTGHTDRDEVFVPRTRSEVGAKATGEGKKKMFGMKEVEELLEDVPIYRLFWLLAQQTLGWPLYIMKNASGQKRYPKWTNHFNPSAIIFDKRHRQDVLLSDAALLAVAGLLYAVKTQIGGANLVKFYVVPYFWVNHWLVMITYLQHTDPIIPHYRPSQWSFPRGALSTMDRNLLGPIGPYILHGICETHGQTFARASGEILLTSLRPATVAHHVASKIPHYHAWEATEALKQLLGPHYLATDENMFYSLWQSYRRCRFVDEDEQVVFYKDSYGNVSRRVQLSEKLVDSGVDFEEEEIE
ncbi:hypothetical protein P7C70_g2843, partial [Phenoliferia sp. Uapishka_3]